MNQIEKSLNHFFQRLGHTPGPWKFEDEYVRSSFLNGTEFGNIVADTCRRSYPQFEKEENANGVLVACSPAMLRTLCRTYLWMLVNIRYRGTLTLDQTLADLRNQISEATGITCQEVQDTFEQYALWIQLNQEIPGEKPGIGDRPDTAYLEDVIPAP